MAKIVFMSPNEELCNFAKMVLNNPSDIDFTIGLLDQAEEIVKKKLKHGTKVVVTRGGTAFALKSTSSGVTVVEIPVTAYDILRAALEARDKGQKIALIGFPNMVHGAMAICPLLGLDLAIREVRRAKDALPLVQEAAAQGADVIMGGLLTTNTAASLGLKTVVIDWGKEAILEAVAQARWLIDVLETERQKTQQLKAILNYTSCGVIGVSAQGKVGIVNTKAERILGKKATSMIGYDISEICPACHAKDVMKEGHVHLRQQAYINGVEIEIDCVPVKIKDGANEAIITLERRDNNRKLGLAGTINHPTPNYAPRVAIGQDKCFKQAWEKARKYAVTDSTVLLQGETGSGKEVFARWIHSTSPRSQGPFLAVNCATLTETLLESELFGYHEGAFTGASKGGKDGLFIKASGGTLFLDEITEISPRLQGALLRILEEKAIRQVGGDRLIPVDVRIIVATNRNLKQAVQQGVFRIDLFYRLNVLTISIPPLRERQQDISLLASHFLTSFAARYGKKMQLSPDAISVLEQYSWPGNVRELENIMERLSILFDHRIIQGWQVREVLPEDKNTTEATAAPYVQLSGTWENMRYQLIRKMLELTGGEKALAAEKLGISRTMLWRVMSKYEGQENV